MIVDEKSFKFLKIENIFISKAVVPLSQFLTIIILTILWSES